MKASEMVKRLAAVLATAPAVDRRQFHIDLFGDALERLRTEEHMTWSDLDLFATEAVALLRVKLEGR